MCIRDSHFWIYWNRKFTSLHYLNRSIEGNSVFVIIVPFERIIDSINFCFHGRRTMVANWLRIREKDEINFYCGFIKVSWDRACELYRSIKKQTSILESTRRSMVHGGAFINKLEFWAERRIIFWFCIHQFHSCFRYLVQNRK